jgi:hypothetical protein
VKRKKARLSAGPFLVMTVPYLEGGGVAGGAMDGSWLGGAGSMPGTLGVVLIWPEAASGRLMP